jgi:thiol-disulfide isomerase/thioredoxin
MGLAGGLLWGNITLAGDTLANFVIRPYMIPQNNIVLERTSLASSSTNNKESLQFGEPFELFKKYYKLSKIDLKSKSIILEKVLYEEFKFGYKENRFVENFKELLAKKEKNLLNKADKINNTDYYIFYFWGEWCQPCLKNIDNNKSKFSILDLNKTNFINVALATSQESKLRTIDLINKRKINGLHLIENINLDSELLISKLSVVTYPSYIVIYKTGKIIYRSDENNTMSFDEFIAKAELVR